MRHGQKIIKICFNSGCNNSFEVKVDEPCRASRCQAVFIRNVNGRVYESPHYCSISVCGLTLPKLCNECDVYYEIFHSSGNKFFKEYDIKVKD